LGTGFGSGATDLEILTIGTLEIATVKKNIADSMSSVNRRLFSMMNKYGCYMVICVKPAITNFSHIPVYATFPGAQQTVFKFSKHILSQNYNFAADWLT
jgi:hypothetical protein